MVSRRLYVVICELSILSWLLMSDYMSKSITVIMIYISYVLDVMLIYVLHFWFQFRAFSIIFLLTYNASALKILLLFYISPYTRSPCTSLRSRGYLIALWSWRKCTAHKFNCFFVALQSCCTILDNKYLWETYFSYLSNLWFSDTQRQNCWQNTRKCLFFLSQWIPNF